MSGIKTTCPKCGVEVTCPGDQLGELSFCPECSAEIQLPFKAELVRSHTATTIQGGFVVEAPPEPERKSGTVPPAGKSSSTITDKLHIQDTPPAVDFTSSRKSRKKKKLSFKLSKLQIAGLLAVVILVLLIAGLLALMFVPLSPPAGILAENPASRVMPKVNRCPALRKIQLIPASKIKTGSVRILHCAPEPGEGVLTPKQLIGQLQPGVMIRIRPGNYQRQKLRLSKLDKVIIESPGAVVKGLSFSIKDCLNVIIKDYRGRHSIYIRKSKVQIFDSEIMSLNISDSKVNLQNCSTGIGIQGKVTLQLNHCQVARFSISGTDSKAVCANSLLYSSSAQVFRFLQGGKADIQLLNCLVYGKTGLGILSESYKRNSPILKTHPTLASMAEYIKAENCLEREPKFTKGRILVDGSPGKQAGEKGHDLGTRRNSQGNFVPF